jgi:hypothetical protein
MKKSTLTLFILLIVNWTALLGQTGNTDTLTCYTSEELLRIANRVVYANECDTLYKITTEQLTIKDSLIKVKEKELILRDSIVENYKDIVIYKDSIIDNNKKHITVLNETIVKTENQVKLVKTGWITTVLGALLLALL